MHSFLEHITINVSNPSKSLPFYKEFFRYFEYDVFKEDEERLAMRKKGTPDFWVVATEEEYLKNKFNRGNTGINHFAFHVASREEVDRFYNEFLQPKNIPTLYSTPKPFPQYTPDYYAVFFEDPDRMKLEVCFISPERYNKFYEL